MRSGDTDRPEAGDIAAAFLLLTRLPVPPKRRPPRGADAAWAWPLAGAAVGTVGALVAVIALALGLPAGFAAAAVLAVQALATGALHEDGLADTADGLLGGATRDRRLEIMKDSRIGSFGALALVLVTLARWSALVALCSSGAAPLVLVAVGALSRAPMAAVMAALPNARTGGLSVHVGRPGPRSVALGLLVAAGIGLALCGLPALWMLALAMGLAGLLAIAARVKIGGQTGDILGATQQLAEAACLAVAAASLA